MMMKHPDPLSILRKQRHSRRRAHEIKDDSGENHHDREEIAYTWNLFVLYFGGNKALFEQKKGHWQDSHR